MRNFVHSLYIFICVLELNLWSQYIHSLFILSLLSGCKFFYNMNDSVSHVRILYVYQYKTVQLNFWLVKSGFHFIPSKLHMPKRKHLSDFIIMNNLKILRNSAGLSGDAVLHTAMVLKGKDESSLDIILSPIVY